MKLFKAHSFLIIGLIIYWGLFFLGPYKHTIYDLEGILYVVIVYVVFIVSCFIAEKVGKRSENIKRSIYISKSAEVYLIFIMLICVIAFLAYMYEVIKLPIPGGYHFARDDYRDFLSLYRTEFNKIFEIFMFIGTAAFLILSRIEQTNFKCTKVFSVLCLFLPAVAILAVGGRSRVVTSIGLFVIVLVINRQEKKQRKTTKHKQKNTRKIINAIICGSVIFIFGYFTFSLFGTRGIYTAPEQYLFSPGDMPLRTPYKNLYESTNGLVNPLYKASMYYTHSIPVFTKTFQELKTLNQHYGGLLFYLEGYILRMVGADFPEYLAIAAENPNMGWYSSFITGYVQDWGIVGTIIAVIITGVIFGRITHNAYKKSVSYYLLPVVLFMCWVSPIYYFWHMGWENVLFLFPFVYCPCRLLGLKSIKIEKEKCL